jgi:hypothetical protein
MTPVEEFMLNDRNLSIAAKIQQIAADIDRTPSQVAVSRLWDDGKISGEMHLSIGEEAIVAGTVLQLQDGDAMALDHRGTSPLVMRGVDMVFCRSLFW